MEHFLPRIRHKIRTTACTSSIQHYYTGSPSKSKKKKDTKIRKEKGNCRYLQMTTVCTENPVETIRKLLEAISEFHEATGHRAYR